MGVVKGYDAKEMKSIVPCEEMMNRQRFDGDSNEIGLRLKKDVRRCEGGRETG
jgi:hypothetical protein